MRLPDETSIHHDPQMGYWWDCAMVSSFEPIFDGCEDNYDVERVLRAAGVIHAKAKTDTESSALVINWGANKQSALRFVARLRAYLVKRAEELGEDAA